MFLEEKCGKITMIENEEGLVNYIIENEVSNIIEKFENGSEQNNIDFNGKEGQTMVNKIKQEMNQIENKIAERTFAPGTSGTGNATNDIKDVVIKEGESSGDDGLKPEIKKDVAGRGNSGDSGVVIEGGKNNVVSGGHNEDESTSESEVSETTQDSSQDEEVTSDIDS